VCLEGVCGTGKKDLLARLEKMGHATLSPRLPFESLTTSFDKSYQERWLQNWKAAVTKKSATPGSVKDNLVFVLRSPVSVLHIFHPSSNTVPQTITKNTFAMIGQLKQDLNFSVVLCNTELDVLQQRLAGRYQLGTEQEKQLCTYYGELNSKYVEQVNSKYKVLLDKFNHSAQERQFSGLEAVINTTSTKQSTTALLRLLGLSFAEVPPAGVVENASKPKSPPPPPPPTPNKR